MIITQQIIHIREDRYRNDIVIMDVPKGYFPAIINNSITSGQENREIEISLLPLEQSPGGKMDCNTGRFLRREHETGIKISLNQDGLKLATSYSAYDSKL